MFSKVDLVVIEIRQCYKELDKFWTDKISLAFEAIKVHRVDPTDFERWKGLQAFYIREDGIGHDVRSMLPPPHLVTDIYAGSNGVYSAVCTLPSPSQEHNSTSLPVLRDKQLSDHGQQFIHATNTTSSSTGGHVSTSQSSPSRILSPPDNLHPRLSYLIKYINKLSSLIDRLQELASCAPTEDRSQLSNQVAALRATFKKRQVHCIEFLQLSEENANRYLLNISDDIQRQCDFLDTLTRRLETARVLRGEAVELHMLYESGIIATMKDLRATGKAVPCCLQGRYTET